MLVATRFAAVRGFEQLEEQEALRTAGRLKKLVNASLGDLSRSVRDFAVWDELATAVERRDSALIEKYFAYDISANSRWSMFAIVKSGGELLLARSCETEKQVLLPLHPAVIDALLALPEIRSPEKITSPQAYIGLLDGELHQIAFMSIRPMTSTDAPTGVLIACRRLDERFCQLVSELLDIPVRLVSAAGGADNTEKKADFVVRDESGGISGCTVLEDWRGHPVAVLRVEHEAHFREQSSRFIALLMAVLVGGAVLLCVLIDRLLLSRLIGRLARISGGLQRIQQSGSLSDRLEVDGHDEITTLLQETNRLLASVQASHQALERANAEMQQRVAERTAALADANAALEADIAERIKAEQEREQLRGQLIRAQKMEAVGTLAGGIAHDFNNILTGILGHAQLLSGALKPGSSEESNLKQVVAAAERAAALVKKILAFSRQTPGERRLVTVSQVAGEALSLLRAGLPAGIEIRCQADTDEDVVHADPTQLHQVFMNLGTNASHAMGSQGGVLEVRIELSKIKNPYLELVPGEYVLITVRDSGCGMSSEVISRIFDPFFSTKPVNEGTGLGLAVVHGIVLDHGGAIDVDSRVGGGTCFRIWLPAARSKADAPALAPSAPLKGDERILLVDDEEIVRSVLEKGLQRLGYRVTAESSGQAALARFHVAPDDFDLVITDQTMPQMSGLQLAAALHKVRAELPVILATGYSPEVSGRDAAGLGLAGIVGKPMHFTELTQIMRRALNNKARPAAVGM
jgi:signal transduction histidine kinase/ActR/RegA family two-component response regulator